LQLEARVEAAAQEELRQIARRVGFPPFYALQHAGSVVALVLYGNVDIHEKLELAWDRAEKKLRVMYGAEIERHLRESKAEHLNPREFYHIHILEALPGEVDTIQLSRAFASAPPWLLKFTGVVRDALVIGFEMPDLSGAPELGRKARAQRDRWPRLPTGTIDAGGPCDDPDPKWTVETLIARCLRMKPPFGMISPTVPR
jgi:hypothetical protein